MINKKNYIIYLLVILLISFVFLYSNKDKEEPKIVDSYVHDFDFTKLSGNERKYYEDDNYESALGIDVSEHQENIDFNQVKADGIEFVFIRIGFRRAVEGSILIDQDFEKNYLNAVNNDLKVGVYFFSQAINEKEAIEEANFVLKTLNNRKLDLPIVYDYEEVYFEDDISRMIHLNKEQRTKNAKAFLSTIDNSIYKSMLYLNLEWLDNYYDIELLKQYDLWFAQYSAVPDIDIPFVIWQFSDVGKVAGIAKEVDLNIYFKKKES